MDIRSDSIDRPSRDRPSRRGPLLLLALVLVIYFVLNRPAGPPAGWGADFPAAMAEAARTDKKVVLAFYMKECPACVAMDRSVLGASAVRQVLEEFIPVRVDVDQERELANRFQVFGTPSFAILDSSGRLLNRCEGYQPVEIFLGFLKQAVDSQPGAGERVAEHPPAGP